MKKVRLTPIFDKKQMSLRLRSEFNDLKRTPLSVANELNIDKSEIIFLYFISFFLDPFNCKFSVNETNSYFTIFMV